MNAVSYPVSFVLSKASETRVVSEAAGTQMDMTVQTLLLSGIIISVLVITLITLITAKSSKHHDFE